MSRSTATMMRRMSSISSGEMTSRNLTRTDGRSKVEPLKQTVVSFTQPMSILLEEIWSSRWSLLRTIYMSITDLITRTDMAMKVACCTPTRLTLLA